MKNFKGILVVYNSVYVIDFMYFKLYCANLVHKNLIKCNN